VGAYAVPRHLPVREEREKVVAHVVRQASHVLRIASRPSRFVRQHGVAPPPGEEAVLPRLRDVSLRAGRHRRLREQDLAVVARPRCGCALDPAHRRALRAPVPREAGPEGDLGDAVTVRVDLALVHRLGRRPRSRAFLR
jgi:hypothetical protein